MKNTYSLRQISAGAVLGLALIISGPASTFGLVDDDKKGDKKARKQQDRSDRDSRKQQDRSDRDSRKQQERSDRGSERQQHESDRSSRGHQRRSDWYSQMQQRRSDAESRRQQIWSDLNSRRQLERGDRDSRRQQRSGERRYENGRGDWNRDVERGDDNRYRRARDLERRSREVFINRNQCQPGWRALFGGQPFWSRDGADPKGEKRIYKDERKAQRRYEKRQRGYERYYGGPFGGGNNAGSDYFSNNSYYPTENSFGGGSDWQEQILRLVIANVIGNRLGTDRYAAAPDYSSFANPVADRGTYSRVQYAPEYNDSYTNQSDDGYAGDSRPGGLLSSGLLDSLPIAELIEQYTGGGGFASELVGNLLTQGYDEGLLAGQFARQTGSEYYRDPYAYAGDIHDPYSTSLGQSRRSLSEGYELGYADALNGDAQYGSNETSPVDLVSLLIGNALGV